MVIYVFLVGTWAFVRGVRGQYYYPGYDGIMRILLLGNEGISYRSTMVAVPGYEGISYRGTKILIPAYKGISTGVRKY